MTRAGWLPAAPLVRAIELASADAGYMGNGCDDHLGGLRSFCQVVLGQGRDWLSKLRQSGAISPWMADQICVRLHLHPFLLWPDLWEVDYPSDEDEERVHEAARRKARLREYNVRKRREFEAKRKEQAA